MTTIVYKDGILATDSRVTWYEHYSIGNSKKIHDINDKIVAVAGNSCVIPEFIKFIKSESFNEKIFEKDEINIDAIVIDKKTKEITIYDKRLLPEKIDAPFICIGSGWMVAAGAILMGATPRQAVECAAKIDLKTNSEIQEIIIKND